MGCCSARDEGVCALPGPRSLLAVDRPIVSPCIALPPPASSAHRRRVGTFSARILTRPACRPHPVVHAFHLGASASDAGNATAHPASLLGRRPSSGESGLCAGRYRADLRGRVSRELRVRKGVRQSRRVVWIHDGQKGIGAG